MANKMVKRTDLEGNEYSIAAPHIAFIDEYLAIGYNGTQAWLNTHPNCNDRESAKKMAMRSLKRPEVQKYLASARKEMFDSKMIDADRIIEELASMAFAPKGDEDYNAPAKLKALDTLAKVYGMFEKKEAPKEQIIRVTIDE